MGSWRTTAIGIAALLVAVGVQAQNLLDNDPETVFEFRDIGIALTALGLFTARDNKTSDEKAGAK